ncbi:MAG: SusF/SusE family outer membrane protein [Bacteroidales bacterium]|nr:SusF/SusE family outer membrane protein [Bacteroidales bacterium]
MKKHNIFRMWPDHLPFNFSSGLRIISFLVVVMMIASCQPDKLPAPSTPAGPLAVTSSTDNLALVQTATSAGTTALTFNWTTGTNHGTGSSIAYLLQIDKKGDNFANPLQFDMGKGAYSKSFMVSEFNDYLLNHWNVPAGTVVQLEARVVDTVFSDPKVTDVSKTVEISASPYQPVSTTLYLIGDATSAGWDATKAVALSPTKTDPTTFAYRGLFNAGNFEFITTLGKMLPAYIQGADTTKIVYRTDSTQADNQFTIKTSGVYSVTVSLLDLSVKVQKMDLPPYDSLFIVGDASPNGWDISNATPLVHDSVNPFIFTYQGVLNAGQFKFPVNRNTDWGQDMYMMASDSTMYLHHGGASDDNKWTIAKKGFYTLTLNLLDNTIKINRTELYIVGSATPIGWSIDKAIALTEDPTDGCIFTYSGPMVAGEFKFPVNRNTDWGQDMYMRVNDSTMYRHVGGAPDDNKWNITDPGNYVITANIQTMKLSIKKQ